VIVGAALIPMAIGFCMGVKVLDGDPGQQKISLFIKGGARALLWSFIFAFMMNAIAAIPYAWPILGACFAFMLGHALWILSFTVWQGVVVAASSVAGFFMGLSWHLGSEHIIQVVIAAMIYACVFAFGILHGRLSDPCGTTDDDFDSANI
jgi:hypothetical protein